MLGLPGPRRRVIMAGRRTDTRYKIQRVALALFTEQGYDRTSLRQIAQQLRITKAAVYYHYKTKEDILGGILAGFTEQLTAVVTWGRGQPASPETRAELLRRYAELITGMVGILGTLQDNPHVLQNFPIASEIRDQVFALFELLAGPDSKPADMLRAQLAVVALHIALAGGVMATTRSPDPAFTRTALEVATELVSTR